MIAFVLAAGESRRLRPITESIPKPMIEIGGAPILEHNLRLLARYGVDDIVVNLHHMPDVIRAHVGDGRRFGVRVTYSAEPVLLGTAGALNAVRGRVDSTFLVMYGDNLSTCRLDALLNQHVSTRAAATIALFDREDVSASGVVDLTADNRVIGFVEKPTPRQTTSHWVNAGIVALEPSVFEFIPIKGPSDFGRDIFPAMLAAHSSVYGYRMTSEGLWWIDTLDDYERTRTELAGGLPPASG